MNLKNLPNVYLSVCILGYDILFNLLELWNFGVHTPNKDIKLCVCVMVVSPSP